MIGTRPSRHRRRAQRPVTYEMPS